MEYTLKRSAILCPATYHRSTPDQTEGKIRLRSMRAVTSMARMVLALAFFGIVFIIQATTEEHNGFLRVNSRDDVAGRNDVDHRALVATSEGDTIASTCSNGFLGIQTGDVCCSIECGRCGGSGCGDLPGGNDFCCTGRISTSGSPCSEVDEAPCFLTGGMHQCGLCGGVGCSSAPGGKDSCCTSAILTTGSPCSDVGEAPCFISNSSGTSMATCTCSNGFPGIQKGDVCCDMECGLCGGVGCSSAPGGADSCCTSSILANGTSCSDVDEAPCFI
ncbi:unnamed protein product [Ascophyllum nodosum]